LVSGFGPGKVKASAAVDRAENAFKTEFAVILETALLTIRPSQGCGWRTTPTASGGRIAMPA